jgi:hypothetical protein
MIGSSATATWVTPAATPHHAPSLTEAAKRPMNQLTIATAISTQAASAPASRVGSAGAVPWMTPSCTNAAKSLRADQNHPSLKASTAVLQIRNQPETARTSPISATRVTVA